MTNYNKVTLIGTMTRDPELLKPKNSEVRICKFCLAINRSYKTASGEKKEEAVFVDIDAFGKPAEIIAGNTKKGSQLLVEGRLRLEQWENGNGEKRSKLGVICEQFQFVGGKKE